MPAAGSGDSIGSGGRGGGGEGGGGLRTPSFMKLPAMTHKQPWVSPSHAGANRSTRFDMQHTRRAARAARLAELRAVAAWRARGLPLAIARVANWADQARRASVRRLVKIPPELARRPSVRDHAVAKAELALGAIAHLAAGAALLILVVAYEAPSRRDGASRAASATRARDARVAVGAVRARIVRPGRAVGRLGAALGAKLARWARPRAAAVALLGRRAQVAIVARSTEERHSCDRDGLVWRSEDLHKQVAIVGRPGGRQRRRWRQGRRQGRRRGRERGWRRRRR